MINCIKCYYGNVTNIHVRWAGKVTCMGEMEMRIQFWSENLNGQQDIEGNLLLQKISEACDLRVTQHKVHC
jgi:hypothetical protein